MRIEHIGMVTSGRQGRKERGESDKNKPNNKKERNLGR